MPQDIAYLTATELTAAYAAGSLSPVDATTAALDRADALEPVLNALQFVDRAAALDAAQASQERWRRGEPLSPLDGVPTTIKDLVPVKGWPMRSGSRSSSDAPCAEDAPVTSRMREAGMVLFGKSTTPEFGWKGMTDTPLSGITRNPWNSAHTSGGSSGGAAVAAAAGYGPVMHGTDGGGSIRLPASYCGLFGIKPSFGRVPKLNNDSPFSTLTADGPIARSVRDAATLLSIMARPDGRDWLSMAAEGWDAASELEGGVGGLRIAVAMNLGGAEPQDDVVDAVLGGVEMFRALGAEIIETGPLFDPLRPTFEPYWIAGFARTLSGIPADKHDLLDPRFRELAEAGRAVSLEQVYQGHAARAALARSLAEAFADFDLLLTPTMPTPPPTADTPYHSQAFDRWTDAVPFTLPFNLTGLPAASMPCGLSRDGLPIGLQLVAPRAAEALLLRASYAYEQAHDWPWPHPALKASLDAM